MGDRFKESRGKKLLQLLNTQNKENCDHNLNKEDHEQLIENYSNECLKNPNNDTILEGRKDAEPIAHCSYNPPENKAADTGAAAYDYFLEDDDDSVKDPNHKSSSSNRSISENPNNDTILEGRKDAEPIAHCSYNPPENKTAHTGAAAYDSFSEDDDDSVKDPNYKSSSSNRSSSSSSTSSSSSSSSSTSTAITNNLQVLPSNDQVESVSIQEFAEIQNDEREETVQNENELINQDEIVEQNNSLNEREDNSNVKKGRKRVARVEEWLSNKAKKLRNTGKSYVSRSKTKKIVPARSLKPPCGDKCKMQCLTKIEDVHRKRIFTKYWELGDITLQRNFINSCTKAIVPAFRFSGKEKPRGYNNAFYFDVDSEKIRVCKKFFMATLDVNDRVLRTVFQKRELGFVEIEKRGRHGHHKKVDDSVKQAVRDHINSIPRIESHYIRKNTSREFIDGGKCIADLHADYKAKCLEQGVTAANYEMYAKIFNLEFNMSFFTPKKDRCELCVSYENAIGSEKERLCEKYMLHLEEKDLSRVEKESDKTKACSDYIIAVYDLQAVLQTPRGDVSVFYYKSKLNSFNFTISQIGPSDHTECYLWHEGEANRGADEIGSCVLSFIDKIMADYAGSGIEFIFYSDNCCGQQKNKFLFSMYVFALMKHSKIKSITHKYLITGHTQNEGDAVHSTIEKAIKKNLRSGPIYVPSQYAQIIRNAKKKGNPFRVNEMSFRDFYSMKSLSETIGFNSKNFKTTEIKVLKLIQGEYKKIFFKYSYKDIDFKEAEITRKQLVSQNVSLKKAYRGKPKIKENKKRDLLSLVQSNHIPNFYADFYTNL